MIADFLKAAAEQYGFVPQRPPSELDFKRAYAKAASAAGLTRDQIVGVYAFETGGNGTYDMQAGVSATRPHAISPAIGYNQLLSTNSVSILAEHGGRLLAALRQKAKALTGDARLAIERKIEALKRMIAFSRSVPDNWNEHDRLAKTTAGGMGIHAAILDIDIGPLLQVQKLLEFGALRARQGLHGAAHRGRTGIDEFDRRRQRLRHGDHAAGHARARADREFLPAVGLRAQSGGAAHRRGGRPDCRHGRQDGARHAIARRQGSGGGVLGHATMTGGQHYGAIVVAVLLAAMLSPAAAQDIRGLEVCTAEKQMERRTGCLQANIEFLQQALTRLSRETQDKIAAAGRDLAAARAEIAALQSALAKLNSELAQMKTKIEASGKK